MASRRHNDNGLSRAAAFPMSDDKSLMLSRGQVAQDLRTFQGDKILCHYQLNQGNKTCLESAMKVATGQKG